MDALFVLSEEERTNFLRYILENFGCTYICLWSYLPYPSNRFLFLDGYYQEENNQASSSSGSLARRHFDQYRREPLFAVNDRVPGIAFKNNSPYLELKELELQRRASADSQRQFYQEAKIKIAVFMGCRSGEIELGWSNVTQLDIANEMRIWFPDDFSRQSPMRELSQAVDQNRHSSSSSSLRSLSMDSPDSSSLIFSIPSTSPVPEALQEAPLLQPIPSTTSPLQEAKQSLQPLPSTTSPLQQVMQYLQSVPSTTSSLQQQMQSLQSIPSTSSPHQQAMQAFALARNIQLPTPEIKEATMTRAILAVLTSPNSMLPVSTSSSSSSSSSTHSLSHMYRVSQGASAFKNYRSALALTTPISSSLRRQSMIKRAIMYYRRLNIARREHMVATRPTSTQLHHMISERKRREKINESFQALRSLLPPEAKKDKATVLTRTREYLITLKAQVEELSRKNQQLEAQLPRAEEVGESSNERLNVRVTHVPESTSEQHIIDLQVTLRGERPVVDMVIRILEFLKQVNNVTVMSMEASTHVAESTSFSRVILRLNIEGNEWDESAFQEAVKRVLADLAQ